VFAGEDSLHFFSLSLHLSCFIFLYAIVSQVVPGQKTQERLRNKQSLSHLLVLGTGGRAGHTEPCGKDTIIVRRQMMGRGGEDTAFIGDSTGEVRQVG
jgi:hypothetical protein